MQNIAMIWNNSVHASPPYARNSYKCSRCETIMYHENRQQLPVSPCNEITSLTSVHDLASVTWTTKTSSCNNPFSRSTLVSRYQINKKFYTLPTSLLLPSSLSTCLPLVNFLHFLWSSASDAHKCINLRSFSTTYFQVYLGLCLGVMHYTSSSYPIILILS